jgi:hypothetical protein
VAAGVVDLTGNAADDVRTLLTFDGIPSSDEIAARAEQLAEIAARYDLADTDDGIDEEFATAAMIGGELWLMAPLEREFRARGVTVATADQITSGTAGVPRGE